MINFPIKKQYRKNITQNINSYQFPLDDYEVMQVSRFDSYNPIKVIDTDSALKSYITDLKDVIGKFIEAKENGFVLRGKIEFRKERRDNQTNEEQIVYTISDPLSIAGLRDHLPRFICVPKMKAPESGSYVEVFIKNATPRESAFFVGTEDIKIIEDLNIKMPPLFVGYSKLSDALPKKLFLNLEEPIQKGRGSKVLSAKDLILMGKMSGENILTENSGFICGVLTKSEFGGSTYDLEAIDDMLDVLTLSRVKESVLEFSHLGSGRIINFEQMIGKTRKEVSQTHFKNHYGGGFGFNANWMESREKENFADLVDKVRDETALDLMVPVKEIQSPPKSSISSILAKNQPLVFGSRALMLGMIATAVKAPIKVIKNQSVKVIRMAYLLKKYEVADNLGYGDEIVPEIKVNEKDIRDAAKILEENKAETSDFIKSKKSQL